MAFVKMSNLLGQTINVPRGAVKAYQGLGFNIDGTVATEVEEVHKEDIVTGDEVELTEDEQFVRELEKRPISQWNKEEVKKYATICGVDTSGAKNVQEAKERVKAFIDAKAE